MPKLFEGLVLPLISQCRMSSSSLKNSIDCLLSPVAKKAASKPNSFATQHFDHFLVLDFEATCVEGAKIMPVQEIIEFPVIQINARTFDEEARFHQYVRPTERPMLTSFCSSLTGIVQVCITRIHHCIPYFTCLGHIAGRIAAGSVLVWLLSVMPFTFFLHTSRSPATMSVVC
ncbi:hypothetical protein AB6A40_010911 [Gnathostoma spinigerum]|uniref:Exonuclease domain-containing protein n=1 Tax=Gnathostoma spinigerum TaxID=75299 RepID=A0ABD6F3L9_9BILA